MMAPGPTELSEEVRAAMGRQLVNPDLDPTYVNFYQALCHKVQQLLHTSEDCLILSGEGILGLEAACASLIEPGTEVLCLANGVFGEGFVDFVRAYGGTPVILNKDYKVGITSDEVEEALKSHPNIKVATLVHCDTPSGLLNPLAEIGQVLRRHGVVSIVDAVASLAGDVVYADDWGLDVVLGGSQKALSAPPGLTFMSISGPAWELMQQRKQPPVGLYLNLLTWKHSWLKDQSFPYTQPVNEHYALDAALDLVLAAGEGVYLRHKQVAAATRNALRNAGFEIYPEERYAANTVTALVKPEGIPDIEFRHRLLQQHGALIAGSYGKLAGKVWRVGHMGSQCHLHKVRDFLERLEHCLAEFGHVVDIRRHLPSSQDGQ